MIRGAEHFVPVPEGLDDMARSWRSSLTTSPPTR
jgi:hypothetical protein